jgi:hypothetical protein
MKYLPRGIEFPVVIIFEEKHGNYVCLATDEHQFYATFQEVFERRVEEGYWYYSNVKVDGKYKQLDAKHIFLALKNDFPDAKLYELPYIYMAYERDGHEYEGFTWEKPHQAEVPSVRPDRYEPA